MRVFLSLEPVFFCLKNPVQGGHFCAPSVNRDEVSDYYH